MLKNKKKNSIGPILNGQTEENCLTPEDGSESCPETSVTN